MPLSEDEEIKQRQLDRQSNNEEREKDRSDNSLQRSRDRSLTFNVAIVSGLVAVTGSLGSQLISKIYSTTSSTESDKHSNFMLHTTTTQVLPDLQTGIFRYKPETGETWYAKFKEGKGTPLEWVRLEVQSASAPLQGSLEPPKQGSVEPPKQGSLEPPKQGSVEPPKKAPSQ